jgi:hypothetical protein
MKAAPVALTIGMLLLSISAVLPSKGARSICFDTVDVVPLLDDFAALLAPVRE